MSIFREVLLTLQTTLKGLRVALRNAQTHNLFWQIRHTLSISDMYGDLAVKLRVVLLLSFTDSLETPAV